MRHSCPTNEHKQPSILNAINREEVKVDFATFLLAFFCGGKGCIKEDRKSLNENI